MTDDIIVRELTKRFRTFDRRTGLLGSLRDVVDRRWRTIDAVAGISFTVPRGQIVGFIGPNGAGKSTTIKMLTGILSPTSGSVQVNGFDPHRQRSAYVRTVGAVFGQRTQLWWDLAVQESFTLLKRIYGVDDAQYRQRLERLDAVLELTPFLATPVRKLSLGQRMKADLAASLLHAPQVLFLDEPTVGLDVVTKDRLRVFLRAWNAEHGSTVILTTHDMQDIESLAERVIVIDHGRIVHDGTLDALAERHGGGKRLVITLRAPSEAAGPALPGLSAWASPTPLSRQVQLAPGLDTGAVLQACLQVWPIADVAIEDPDIDAVVRQLYAGRS